jgi:hypothetical protein
MEEKGKSCGSLVVFGDHDLGYFDLSAKDSLQLVACSMGSKDPPGSHLEVCIGHTECFQVERFSREDPVTLRWL